MLRLVLTLVVILAIGGSRGQAECTFEWQPEDGIPGVHGGSISSGSISAVTTWDPDGPGPEPERLVVGGLFSMAGQTPALNIAYWDGANWHSMGSGMNSTVWALIVYNGKLIAGGDFTMAGDVPVNRIARWNGSRWHPLGEGVAREDPTLTANVLSFAVFGDSLIVGGRFTFAGGAPVNNIASWNGSGWSALGDGLPGIRRGGVRAVTVLGTELIAGGDFNLVSGAPGNYVAAWNGVSWQALGTGMNRAVWSLTVVQGELGQCHS